MLQLNRDISGSIAVNLNKNSMHNALSWGGAQVLIRKMELLEWCGDPKYHVITSFNISANLLCGIRVVGTNWDDYLYVQTMWSVVSQLLKE